MRPEPPTTYLDFAATCAIRPAAVVDAVTRYLGSVGATPGRSSHRLAVEAGRVSLHCRRALAKLLRIPGDPGRVALMFNATHALNTALWGTLRPGNVVVTTDYDHNAVRRPLHALAVERNVEVRRVPGAPDGSIDVDAVRQALDGARLLVLNAASNVLGSATQIAPLARLAHDAGALVLVDAAQAAGHRPLDVQAEGIDLLAFAGHKGLLGPQGTGGLWVSPGTEVEPLLRGGTGGDSSLADMPPAYPDHLEAGSANGPGVAGLLAGVEWLLDRSPAALHRQSMALKERLYEGLSTIRGVRVVSPSAPDGVPIVTIVADSVDPGALARRLDQEHGILVRAGLHCAPDAHQLLGTAKLGAVRFSLGWSSTAADVDRALRAVDAIVSGRLAHASASPRARGGATFEPAFPAQQRAPLSSSTERRRL